MGTITGVAEDATGDHQIQPVDINGPTHTQWLGVDNACHMSLTACAGQTDTFRQITSTRNPREIQLSLKLYW